MDSMPQHKRLAQGERVGFKKGGSVAMPAEAYRKTGLKETPLERSKRDNGVPGMKKGGKACGPK